MILLAEEYGELCDAVIEEDSLKIIDALGDIMIYGLGLCAMFDFDADRVICQSPWYADKPKDISKHLIYVGSAVGMFAKCFKKSNRVDVSRIDRVDEFRAGIGNLLGYCRDGLGLVGEDYVSVLEKIVSDNPDREHLGYI
jgi:hypothetical protein